MEKTVEQKKNRLFIVLSGIFLTNALLAEIIGTKIFSLEATLGMEPANLNILGFTMNFYLTAGAIIWPVVFITTDLINEYFGQPGVKRISYFTAGLITYSFLIIFLSIRLQPADFWLSDNGSDGAGNKFNINYAFGQIFGQSLRIIFASLCAFLIGQLIDVYTFHLMRKATGPRMLWLRSTGSTLVSQLIDSFVVLFIAFYGKYSTEHLVAMAITNYIYKFTAAVVLTPLIYVGHFLIDRYLGKEHAHQTAEEAANKSQSFF